jgi:hypothetical protein
VTDAVESWFISSRQLSTMFARRTSAVGNLRHFACRLTTSVLPPEKPDLFRWYADAQTADQRREFWKNVPDWIKDRDWVRAAYAQGVPMGGDLTPMPASGKPPSLREIKELNPLGPGNPVLR